MNDVKPEAPRRIRRFQTISLGLLVVCGTINYLDRGALSVANPAIRADLGVSIGEMGLLLSAFAWSYALAQLPVGETNPLSARSRSSQTKRPVRIGIGLLPYISIASVWRRHRPVPTNLAASRHRLRIDTSSCRTVPFACHASESNFLV